jgi:hypothetical protein
MLYFIPTRFLGIITFGIPTPFVVVVVVVYYYYYYYYYSRGEKFANITTR